MKLRPTSSFESPDASALVLRVLVVGQSASSASPSAATLSVSAPEMTRSHLLPV